jgi:hypothetical protein
MKTMNTPCLCWVRENKHRLRNSSTHIWCVISLASFT